MAMSYQSQGFKAPYIQVSCDSDQWFLSYKMIFKKVPNIETVFWPTVHIIFLTIHFRDLHNLFYQERSAVDHIHVLSQYVAESLSECVLII